MKLASLSLTLMLLSAILFGSLSIMIPNAEAVDLSSPPEIVNDEPFQKTSIDTFVTDSGRIYIVWSEKRVVDFDIYLSYSSNNGTTFSDNILVNSETTGNQLYPKVVANQDETVFVVWQDMGNDTGDIKLARSFDKGETFSNGILVNSFQMGAQSYPDLAVNGDDVTVVWEESRSDSTIRLWNPDTGALVREMDGHSGAVRCLGFSPTDNKLVSGGEDDLIKVWNSQTGAFITNLTDHTDTVTSVNWTSDGSIFATGSWDHNVTLWNSADYSIITQYNEINNGTADVMLKNPVNAIAFSPDATQTTGQMAVAYNGRLGIAMPTGEPTEMWNLTVWNMSDSSSWTVNEANGGHGSSPGSNVKSVMDVAFSHNGTYLASCSKDDNVMIWNATSSVKFDEVDLNMDVLSVCWSPDDTEIAASLSNGTIVVFNFSNPTDRYWLKQHNGRVNDLSWSVVRNELASGASDQQAKVWDLANQIELVNLTDHLNSVYAIDWNPQGNLIATAGGNSNQHQMGESQIFSSVSANEGLSFPDAVIISDSCAGMRHRPKVATDSSGYISVVWYDLRDGIEQVYYANSSDTGATFGVNTRVAKNLGKVQNVPEIAVETETGKVHVVWQFDQGTSIHYANSSDGFQNGIEIAASGQLPRVSTSASGSSTWVTWRDSGVNVTVSYDRGSTFTDLTIVMSHSPSLDGSMPGISIETDSFDQTSISWLIGTTPTWNVYHVSSVVTDTWRPIVTGTLPPHSAVEVSVFTQIQVNFSEPMDKQSVQDAFSVSNGTVLDADDCLDIYWSDYGDKVIFTLDEPLDYLDVYVVTIAASAQDISGNTMQTQYVFSFSTRDDVDPPVIIHDQTIFEVNYDEVYVVEATIIDWWGSVTSATVHYMGVGGTTFQPLAMTHSGNDIYTATIPAQNALGNVTYYIGASDNHGNAGVLPVNTSQYFNYTVVDRIAPEISHTPITEFSVFKPIPLSAHVEDEIELDRIEIVYVDVNLSIETLSMAFNSSNNQYSVIIPAQNDVGEVIYWIRAVDGSGNQNTTSNFTIAILDLTIPLINAVTAEHRANQTEVLVRANVTDDVAVVEVTLFFKAVGGDHWVERNMPLVSGDFYEFVIPAQMRSGTIEYYVNATDTSGNLASTLTEADEFEIEVVGVGTNWTIYIILSAVLGVLVVVLMYLLLRRAKGKDQEPKQPEPSDEPPQPEVRNDVPDSEVYPDEEKVDAR